MPTNASQKCIRRLWSRGKILVVSYDLVELPFLWFVVTFPKLQNIYTAAYIGPKRLYRLQGELNISDWLIKLGGWGRTVWARGYILIEIGVYTIILICRLIESEAHHISFLKSKARESNLDGFLMRFNGREDQSLSLIKYFRVYDRTSMLFSLASTQQENKCLFKNLLCSVSLQLWNNK